jgi:predicted Zn-dependent protease
MARILRFFMGIPGGDKRLGLKQLQVAAAQGQLTKVEARFNMAKSLRNYDFDYAQAAEAAGSLITEFPENPIFLLVEGDIEAKLGHNAVAAERYRAAAVSAGEDAACTGHVQRLAHEALGANEIK